MPQKVPANLQEPLGQPKQAHQGEWAFDAAMSVASARGGSTPKRFTAWRSPEMQGLDVPLRMSYAEPLGVSARQGPADGWFEKAGGMISNGISRCEGGKIHPRGAHVAYGPALRGPSQTQISLGEDGQGQ